MWASGLQEEEQKCSPDLLQPTAEKVSSLGKDWHKFCLKCERCNKTLTPGGHAEHDGKPFCHKPCYATLFGPKGKQGLSQGQLLWVLVGVGVSSALTSPSLVPPLTWKALKQPWEEFCVRDGGC